jgi:hypothetical protein
MLAKYVMDTGVQSPPISPGDNSTYQLEFRAPQYQCNETKSSDTVPWEEVYQDRRSVAFESGWVNPIMFANIREYVFFVRQRRYVGAYSKYPVTDMDNAYAVEVETMLLQCRPISMHYILNVSYLDGVLNFEHAMDDPQTYDEFSEMDGLKYILEPQDAWPWSPNHSDISTSPPDFQNWVQLVRKTLPVWNHVAVVFALGDYMQSSWSVQEPYRANRSDGTAPMTRIPMEPDVPDTFFNNDSKSALTTCLNVRLY